MLSPATAASIFALAFVVSAAILALLLRKQFAWRLATDVPNDRSLHSEPVPRVGGWGVMPAAIVVAFAFGERSWLLLALAALLFVVSYADDRLVGSLTVDSARLRSTLGWTPPHSVEEGLQATGRWFVAGSA